jgi:hypothetical protein
MSTMTTSVPPFALTDDEAEALLYRIGVALMCFDEMERRVEDRDGAWLSRSGEFMAAAGRAVIALEDGGLALDSVTGVLLARLELEAAEAVQADLNSPHDLAHSRTHYVQIRELRRRFDAAIVCCAGCGLPSAELDAAEHCADCEARALGCDLYAVDVVAGMLQGVLRSGLDRVGEADMRTMVDEVLTEEMAARHRGGLCEYPSSKEISSRLAVLRAARANGAAA